MKGEKSFLMRDLPCIAGKGFALMADGTRLSTPAPGTWHKTDAHPAALGTHGCP
jgi:hypothetical protein